MLVYNSQDIQSKIVKETNTNSNLVDITQHEIAALKMKYNLADAHTHQKQSPSQREFLSHLPSLWYESERKTQYELEQNFINAFFRLHKQSTAFKLQRTTLFYSASVATMVVGNYLLSKGMSIALLEPCFDNLYDILKNYKLNIQPLPEQWFHKPDEIYNNLSQNIHTDGVFLVDPNNPTGFSLLCFQEKAFKEVIRFCKDKNKLLVFDFCFASFALMDETIGRFDIYGLLEESGIQYIAIEDTGKTWPLQDAKCALLTVSQDIYEEVYNIHTAVLLNVSPFILNLVTQYVCDSERDNFHSVKSLLDTNRKLAKSELSGTLLQYQEPKTKVSVAWFKIQQPEITSTEIQKMILSNGVYVLPGTYFFWSNHIKGEE